MHLPFVEARHALFHPDLRYHIPRRSICRSRVVRLQSRSNYLIGVCDTAGEYLRRCAEVEIVKVAQLCLSANLTASVVLQLLVCHELDRAVRNAEQRGE